MGRRSVRQPTNEDLELSLYAANVIRTPDVLQQVDRVLSEHTELCAALIRTNYLLTSGLLLITDKDARATAAEQIEKNCALLARVRAK